MAEMIQCYDVVCVSLLCKGENEMSSLFVCLFVFLFFFKEFIDIDPQLGSVW